MAQRHRHSWHVEQQTGHRFCGACGEHQPPDPLCADRPSGLWRFVTSRGRERTLRRLAADDLILPAEKG